MGIYIKGMKKKPKDCKACFLGLYDRQTYCRNGEKALCPLIEVKTPHGDLIDRDRAVDGAKADGAWAALAYEPAIIEAEGGK